MDVPPRCYLSDPVHPHTLSRRRNPAPSECFTCGPDGKPFEDGDWHYYCNVCELVFHNNKYCKTSSLVIRHPYLLQHAVNFTLRVSETESKSFSSPTELTEFVSKVNSSLPSYYENPCDWCGTSLGSQFYQCLLCGFTLDNSCIKKDPPFTITNPKSHKHSLNLFPKPLSVTCSACGLGYKKTEPSYFCQPCNFFVHLSCIDLPSVIKLTRHPHRLSYIPCLPPHAKRLCGVCHGNINVKHGMYSCDKGCPYAVHSACATHEDIWDGIDLEGVPEEPLEDIASFEEVGDNLIKHFSHDHYLRFHEDGVDDRDTKKECQACCRVVESGGFYGCTILHCDFFLHAPCANFPKKKEHPVHKHPLTLQPRLHTKLYKCYPCGRECSGFRYQCLNYSCNGDDDKGFKMDVLCASVSEPFHHQAHPHPLYIFPSEEFGISFCGICGELKLTIVTLNCTDCSFTMCFMCATIPFVMRYTHDEHLLTLCCGEDSSDRYWCERCEGQIDPKKWFYACNQCSTTLHVDCLFDDAGYIKIGWSFGLEEGKEITFASNNGNSRPVCDRCGVSCLYRGVFKRDDQCFCSVKCYDSVRDHDSHTNPDSDSDNICDWSSSFWD